MFMSLSLETPERTNNKNDIIDSTGYDIRVVCDTEVFILFKRNGKFYTFANTEELVWPTEEDIAKEKASKANVNTSCPSYASEDMSTLPLLGIKTPESPRLDLSS
ncbi:hypothetical protein BKA61DRAFT_571526 [Leptodontidium sp. MPI-SDFR-AT-0119]|nr:hypothetical protein BKA61DRAFT_571526 [Leptodontidium sp. MPI-SDFR-AT-0119]